MYVITIFCHLFKCYWLQIYEISVRKHSFLTENIHYLIEAPVLETLLVKIEILQPALLARRIHHHFQGVGESIPDTCSTCRQKRLDETLTFP